MEALEREMKPTVDRFLRNAAKPMGALLARLQRDGAVTPDNIADYTHDMADLARGAYPGDPLFQGLMDQAQEMMRETGLNVAHQGGWLQAPALPAASSAPSDDE